MVDGGGSKNHVNPEILRIVVQTYIELVGCGVRVMIIFWECY